MNDTKTRVTVSMEGMEPIEFDDIEDFVRDGHKASDRLGKQLRKQLRGRNGRHMMNHTPVQEQQLVLDFKQAIRQAEALGELDGEILTLDLEIDSCNDIISEDLEAKEAEDLKEQIAQRRAALLEDDPLLEELAERRKTAMAEVRKTEAYKRRTKLKKDRKELLSQRSEQALHLESGLRNAAK